MKQESITTKTALQKTKEEMYALSESFIRKADCFRESSLELGRKGDYEGRDMDFYSATNFELMASVVNKCLGILIVNENEK